VKKLEDLKGISELVFSYVRFCSGPITLGELSTGPKVLDYSNVQSHRS
jgi:hypothetical protein